MDCLRQRSLKSTRFPRSWESFLQAHEGGLSAAQMITSISGFLIWPRGIMMLMTHFERERGGPALWEHRAQDLRWKVFLARFRRGSALSQKRAKVPVVMIGGEHSPICFKEKGPLNLRKDRFISLRIVSNVCNLRGKNVWLQHSMAV